MALTGAVSRFHTICRNTWPKSAIPAACQALANQYIKFGADKSLIQQCMTKIVSKYRLGKNNKSPYECKRHNTYSSRYNKRLRDGCTHHKLHPGDGSELCTMQ